MEAWTHFSNHVSQLYLPGAVALWCSLFFGLAALWGYTSSLAGDRGGVAYGHRAYRLYALSIVLVSCIFGYLLVLRDFRIEYVFQYSGLDLPAHYQFAAFWAGQKGSFLIWLFWGSVIGLILVRAAGRLEAGVMSVYLLTLFGLLLILAQENPFVMLRESPTDGKGLNPLLQDDWMVIHPPIMFIGYALTAVPFSFAITALWRRDFKDWAARAFPWALSAFLVLGAAILMGGYWAYKTLGWGGYWGWDPVENASLIPWLLTTVLIHGLYLERTRGRYRRANLILACLGYLAVLYGTFLTRSGVLADFSVHSFVDLGISGLLVFLMVFFAGGSLFLLATRLPKLPTVTNEDPPLSRGSFVVLSTIAITASAVVVTLGTSAPLLTRFMENPGQVGPSFYNRVNQPIALLLALLLAAVPVLTWGEHKLGELARRLRGPALFGLAVTIFAVVLGSRDLLHLLLVFLASTAIASNLLKTIERARRGGLAGAGGYLAHVGVGIILLGFLASSAYDHSTKVTLVQGEVQQVSDMEVTFTRFVPRTAEAKERLELKVVRDGRTFYAYPSMFVNDRTRQLMVNPDIRKLLTMDLYFSPLEYDPGTPPSQVTRLELVRGESRTLGDSEIRFLDFDLDASQEATLTSLDQGEMITVGARLAITRGDETLEVRPLYHFDRAGQIQYSPARLPGGAQIALAGINASAGAARLEVLGLVGGDQDGAPPKLAIDVTRKPLIRLVWWGLFVILGGGALSTINRVRQLRRLDQPA